MKKKHQDNLQKRYKLKEKGKPKAKGEILQRIKVKTAKISRYQQMVSQFQQDSFFLEIMRVGFISKQMEVKREKRL